MADAGPKIPNCNYDPDPNFPLDCRVDYSKAYCCFTNDQLHQPQGFISCTPPGICPGGAGSCSVGTLACNMSFPYFNSSCQPTLKTALSGTAMSPWARIAFQEFCGENESPTNTAKTIITMGNLSEPFAVNSEDEPDPGVRCNAIIKEFQYGWGTINQGNRVRIKILDQKGSTFQRWVERMAINPEADSTPIQGKYRMKVQFGWYTSGGADSDVCGQQPMPIEVSGGILPIGNAAPGFNTSFIICSPVMYFVTDWINVHYESNKFIYELEGTDLLVRGQEFMIKQVFGQDRKNMYFTKACQLLGAISFPTFRVEFKALDQDGKVVPLEFAPRDTPGNGKDRMKITDDTDCEGYGPYDKWYPDTRPPLAVIHEWVKQGVFAKDKTGQVTSNGGKVGITLNYDPTYKYTEAEDFWVKFRPPNSKKCNQCAVSNIPNYGRLTLWQNSIPYCQTNFSEPVLNARMKAVYIVNGGNCSPVLHFAPSFRWHSMAAQRTGGILNPNRGTARGQTEGAVRTGCAIASGNGPVKNLVVTRNGMIQKVNNPDLTTMEATYHHIMTNLMIGAIEADLRVQGDPADWLCSPIHGYGRCVGIVFINPYFLIDTGKDCPEWASGDPHNNDPQFRSACNQLLTNKGWFLMGADHQIKEGQFITTLRLKLIAPGAELNPAGSITNLGGWGAVPNRSLPYGGQFGCLSRFLVGNTGTGWGEMEFCPATYVGGGTACSADYDTAPPVIPDS